MGTANAIREDAVHATSDAILQTQARLGDLNTTSGDDVVSVWKSWTPEQRLEILGVTNE